MAAARTCLFLHSGCNGRGPGEPRGAEVANFENASQRKAEDTVTVRTRRSTATMCCLAAQARHAGTGARQLLWVEHQPRRLSRV